MSTHPSSLEERITELQKPENQGAGFQPRDWLMLALTGVVLPVGLLIWGW